MPLNVLPSWCCRFAVVRQARWCKRKANCLKRSRLIAFDRLKTVLGVDIRAEQVETILQHLGLQPEKTAEGFRVTAPSFRFDIEIEADLIEEIGRVYGYENIPDDYTSGRLKMLELPETRRSRFAVYNEMAARGYREVVSHAFADEQWE